jgi:hypothetical protein
MTDEQRQRIVHELRDAINRHERHCGEIGTRPHHNIGDGVSLARSDAEALIALLERQ